MHRKSATDFPPDVLKLFDGYIHGNINRRDFLDRASKYAVGGFTAAAMLESLTPNYALAQQVARTDPRNKTKYLTYPSPEGSGTMRGYLAMPANATGKLPGVLVIHENRGLNPHIEDIARRLALDNFVAFAPDALTPVGGYPGNDEAAMQLFAKLDPNKQIEDRINAGWPAFEAALKANGVNYQMFMYPGTNHGFNNDTTPRYDDAAAKLAWSRTVGFFNERLRART